MLARRYNQLPSELKDISIQDYQFNILVASLGLQSEENERKKAEQKARLKRGK